MHGHITKVALELLHTKLVLTQLQFNIRDPGRDTFALLSIEMELGDIIKK